MKTTFRIDSFQGPFRFLSNFWYVTVELDGERYPSVEHAYQAAKTLRAAERAVIREARTPGAAKRRGQHVTLRKDWEDAKLGIMLQLLRQKFAKPQLREMLLGTGNAELVEGNTWGDTYWGVHNGVGANHLGRLLMQVREELHNSLCVSVAIGVW